MLTPDRMGAVFERLSREICFVVDAEWRIRWLDERAKRVLHLDEGASLREACAPGGAEKLDRLSTTARSPEGCKDPWEVVVVIDGAPRVLALHAAMLEDGSLAVLGSTVPEAYAQALSQVSTTLSEMTSLHRESDRQQRELLRRHEELVRVHRDLDESTRGVVALHAELGDKDSSLRRANEVKTRLVANVSHELRTPINSILGLTKLLLERSDGELNSEQEKQLGFVKQSAESLNALVDDMLELSRVEAGRILLRTAKFPLPGLVASMRGMLKPLAASPNVDLIFEQAPNIELEQDEAKISQVLRNLVANALKFTERGSVRVTATAEGDHVVLSVADTGIGIPLPEQDRIFDEFYQVDSPVQKRVKGTGLGLTLSRRLADRLGGSLTVESREGIGSTFRFRIPIVHPEAREMHELERRSDEAPAGLAPILVVEDDRQTLFLYEKYLRGAGFNVVPARTVDDARAALRKINPAAIVLDVMLDGETSWQFLRDLKNNPETREIPTLVVTVTTSGEAMARALGADEFHLKPLDREWLVLKLRALARLGAVERVLVIDDDQVSRYLVRKHLEGLPYEVLEAAAGLEGVRLARERRPNVIFLDFVLPEMSAFDVLDELKKDPATRNIPVIIHTSKDLAVEERRRLEAEASAIVHKQSLSREVAIGRIREALEKAGIHGRHGGKE